MSWRSTRAAAREQPQTDKVAVIDLGSNSWRAVIFSYGTPALWWKRTDELYETVRIGAGLHATGRLSDEAMARGLETLAVFAHFCQANEVRPENVHAVATSAFREAANGAEFARAAAAETGIEIDILSEEQEAFFGYVAAINTSTLEDGVVLEIGGGSLQLIRVEDRNAMERPSFPLGAVTVTEELLPGSEPASKRELARVRAHVKKSLQGLLWLHGPGEGKQDGPGEGKKGGDPDGKKREPDPRRLVGLGGAVRNLAAAAQHALGSPDLGVQGAFVSRSELRKLVRRIAAMAPSERSTVPGVKPGRGDIILAAALVIETVVELGGFTGIEATEAGLREGVFLARTLCVAASASNGSSAAMHVSTNPCATVFGDVREAAVRNLAIQYEPDLAHAQHVARLSLEMFDSLVEQQMFEPLQGERELLWAASMLHDVGMTIAYDDHHKHSQYLIMAAELPGFDPRERGLIAQISRYHRKGSPKLGELSAVASDADEGLLERCAVILRLAEHLERGRDQTVAHVRLRGNGSGVDLHLEASGENLILPRWSVERYADDEAFERVFGRGLVIG